MRFGDLSGTPDMLCSSVFDRDDEFFATAGVSRKIKVGPSGMCYWPNNPLLDFACHLMRTASHRQVLSMENAFITAQALSTWMACHAQAVWLALRICCKHTPILQRLHDPCHRHAFHRHPTVHGRLTDAPAAQVFELAGVEDSGGEGCFPVAEMQAQHKLSCLVWSGYLKSSLLAADYAGMLQMWDVNQRVPTTSFHQHTKRVWSADFCPVSCF